MAGREKAEHGEVLCWSGRVLWGFGLAGRGSVWGRGISGGRVGRGVVGISGRGILFDLGLDIFESFGALFWPTIDGIVGARELAHTLDAERAGLWKTRADNRGEKKIKKVLTCFDLWCIIET